MDALSWLIAGLTLVNIGTMMFTNWALDQMRELAAGVRDDLRNMRGERQEPPK